TLSYYLFFFYTPATSEIYTLSLHDALPIYERREAKVIPFHRNQLCLLALAAGAMHSTRDSRANSPKGGDAKPPVYGRRAYDSGVAGSNVNALRSHSATCCGS